MVTIARITEKYIEQRPFLQEALSRGIINYGALADSIMPYVKKEFGKPVKHAAVMMALRRLTDKLEKKFVSEENFQKHLLDLSVKSNLFDLTVVKTPETLASIKELYKIADFNRGDVLSITQSYHEITIISNQYLLEKIEAIFAKKGKVIKKKIKHVSSLTVTITPKATEIPGFYYTILRALAWHNINVVEVVSTFTELMFLLSEDDVTRAYNVLRGLLVEH